MKAEDKLQQNCFLWHWNTRPDERGRLWMQYNNPPNRIQGARLKGMGMVAGVSDMAYLRSDGRTVYLEFKLPGQKQSKKQRWWESVVKANAGEYLIITTEEEFKTLIMNIEILDQLFDGHLSRNRSNIIKAMKEHGIDKEEMGALIECKAIKILDFGEGQVHLERQPFSQEALEKLFETQTTEL